MSSIRQSAPLFADRARKNAGNRKGTKRVSAIVAAVLILTVAACIIFSPSIRVIPYEDNCGMEVVVRGLNITEISFLKESGLITEFHPEDGGVYSFSFAGIPETHFRETIRFQYTGVFGTGYTDLSVSHFPFSDSRFASNFSETESSWWIRVIIERNKNK